MRHDMERLILCQEIDLKTQKESVEGDSLSYSVSSFFLRLRGFGLALSLAKLATASSSVL